MMPPKDDAPPPPTDADLAASADSAADDADEAREARPRRELNRKDYSRSIVSPKPSAEAMALLWRDDDALEKLASETLADGDSVAAMVLARGVIRLLAEKENVW